MEPEKEKTEDQHPQDQAQPATTSEVQASNPEPSSNTSELTQEKKDTCKK